MMYFFINLYYGLKRREVIDIFLGIEIQNFFMHVLMEDVKGILLEPSELRMENGFMRLMSLNL